MDSFREGDRRHRLGRDRDGADAIASLVSKVNFGRFCGRRLESSDRSENKIITIWKKQFQSVFVQVCLPLREGDVERDVDSRLV